MKVDRYRAQPAPGRSRLRRLPAAFGVTCRRPNRRVMLLLCVLGWGPAGLLRAPAADVSDHGDEVAESPAEASSEPPAASPQPKAPAADSPASEAPSDSRPAELLQRVLRRLAYGHAFNAKVRQRVWASGREVIGVGSYEQAGGGSGQFNLQVTMHDGDGKHTLQQISDGKLAWTRTAVADQVTLRRVNLGALKEAAERLASRQEPTWSELVGSQGEAESDPPGPQPIPTRLLVGGLTELLDQIGRDYSLRVSGGRLEQQPVWIVSGELTDAARSRLLDAAGVDRLPPLSPNRVRVAIAAAADPATGFGLGLPVRLEYWSDAADSEDQPNRRSEVSQTDTPGRLISLIELYAIQPIDPPPTARFKFASEDGASQFVDETERYASRSDFFEPR